MSTILTNTSLVLVQNHSLPYVPSSTIPLYSHSSTHTHISLSCQKKLFLPELSEIHSILEGVKYGTCPIINEQALAENTRALQGRQPYDLEAATNVVVCEIDMQACVLYLLNGASQNASTIFARQTAHNSTSAPGVQRLYFEDLPIIYFHNTALWSNHILYITESQEVHVLRLTESAMSQFQKSSDSTTFFKKNSYNLENEDIASILSGTGSSSSSSWFSFGGAFRGIQGADSSPESASRSNCVKSVKFINQTLYILREHSIEAWELNHSNLPHRVWIYKLEHLLKRQYASQDTFVLDFVVQQGTQITLLIASKPTKYSSDQTPLIQYHLCYLNMNHRMLPSIDTFYTLKKFSKDYHDMGRERLTNVKLFAFQDTYYLYFEQENSVKVAVHPFVTSMMKEITLKDVVGAAMLGPDLYVYSSTDGVYVVSTHLAKEQYLKLRHGTSGTSQFRLYNIRPHVQRHMHTFARDQLLQMFRLYLQGKPVDKGALAVSSEDIIDACRLIVDAPFASTYQWTNSPPHEEDSSGATILIREHIQRKCEDFDRFMEFLGMDLWKEFTNEERNIILELGEKLYATRGVRIGQSSSSSSTTGQSGELNGLSSQVPVHRVLFDMFKKAAIATCENSRHRGLTTERATIELFFTFSSNIQEFFVQLTKRGSVPTQQQNVRDINYFIGSIFQHAIQQIKEFRSTYHLRYNDGSDMENENSSKRCFTPWTCSSVFRQSLCNHVTHMRQQMSHNSTDVENPVLRDMLYDLADFHVDCTLDKKICEQGETMSDNFEQIRAHTFDMLTGFNMLDKALLLAEKYHHYEALIGMHFRFGMNEIVAYLYRFGDDFLQTLIQFLINKNQIEQLFELPREFWPKLDVALQGYPQMRWMLAVHMDQFVDASAYLDEALHRHPRSMSRKVALSLKKLCQLTALANGEDIHPSDISSNEINIIEQQDRLTDLGVHIEQQDRGTENPTTAKQLIESALGSIIAFDQIRDFQRTDPTRFEGEIERADRIMQIALQLYKLSNQEDAGGEMFARMLFHAFKASYPLQKIVDIVAQDAEVQEDEVKELISKSALAHFVLRAPCISSVTIAEVPAMQYMREKAAQKVFRSALDFLLQQRGSG